MNRSILTAIFLAIGLTSYSQQMAITYYDSAWLLTTKDFARYSRTGIIDTINFQYFGEVRDYYMSGKLQMKGKFRANIKLDTFYFYYPSGMLMTKGAYENNIRYGIWTNYYENGRIKDKVVFNGDFLFAIEYYAEGGAPKMINGTGEWETEYYNDYVMELVSVHGQYKDTLRHGTWTYYKKSLIPGQSHEQKLQCIEEYNNGRLIEGKYYWGGGGIEDIGQSVMNILPETRKFDNLKNWAASVYASIEAYPYLKFLSKVDSTVFPVDQFAEFPGGVDSLTKIFQRNMKLSRAFIASQELRSCTFHIVISEEGKIKITKDSYAGFEYMDPDDQVFHERAMRIARKLPKWTPATRGNKKVSNYFVFGVYLENGQISIQLISHNKKSKV